MKFKKTVILILCLFTFFAAISQQNNPEILVFTKTTGFRHKSIPSGINYFINLKKVIFKFQRNLILLNSIIH